MYLRSSIKVYAASYEIGTILDLEVICLAIIKKTVDVDRIIYAFIYI